MASLEGQTKEEQCFGGNNVLKLHLLTSGIIHSFKWQDYWKGNAQKIDTTMPCEVLIPLFHYNLHDHNLACEKRNARDVWSHKI